MGYLCYNIFGRDFDVFNKHFWLIILKYQCSAERDSRRCIYIWCRYAWCLYICSLIIMHMSMMHQCMMNTSMILEIWLCSTCVWCIYPWCGNFVTEGRTEEPTLILTRVCMMHVFMMRHICHVCTNLDSDAYVHHACMNYAYTYV